MNSQLNLFFESLDTWKSEAALLRKIIKEESSLIENYKWSKPCYAYADKNIAILQPFKSCLALMFFKGALLKDASGLLVENGPNSRLAKRLEFKSVSDVSKMRSKIAGFIREAITVENSSVKIKTPVKPVNSPAELTTAFAKSPKLKRAFDALTPGRQRAFLLYFTGAKQSSTRQTRIQKCIPTILAGKGINE